jgi:hypothetical protein
MESVRKRFEADRGQLFAYRYNQKHRFDPKWDTISASTTSSLQTR